MNTHPHTPFLLCIMDGVGSAPEGPGNAVHLAHTPTLDKLFATAPHSTLLTHGKHVGLPDGQMGNSEVGHMAIGSGRVLLQPLERIRADLSTGDLQKRNAWQDFMQIAKKSRRTHVIGLMSDGGVHSHIQHALGLLNLLSDADIPVSCHIITDGRDTAPKSAMQQLHPLLHTLQHTMPQTRIATLCGRYYAMDRDRRWQRTESYFNTLIGHPSQTAPDALSALKAHYEQAIGDEFIPPVALTNDPDAFIQDGDALLFVNFRADRMRQIVEAFINPAFTGFTRLETPKLSAVATLTRYDAVFTETASVPFMEIYAPETVKNTLGQCLAEAGLKQLRIAETEKYPHVTYFFSGGQEEALPQENRILVHSPKVATYDLQPEMSLPEVTTRLLETLEAHQTMPDVIILNMANGDMVGHSGVIPAAIKAVEAVDNALSLILPRLLALGGEALLIADHGNCEEMLTPEGAVSTSHSLNPVPCLYVGRPAHLKNGVLKDVAPTVLTCLGLPIPKEMEGQCLIQFL